MHPMDESSVSSEDIFDCIQRGNVEQCIHLVQNDRSVLKSKGWGGFTPLHYAALHGNRALVDLFLCSGADPNLTCDAGQTAFHFACRQGNIYILHEMMQYGADLRLTDFQGKTSLHHAVTGGNIVAVHYLWETGMFRFSDTDMYQVTPLHLAASTSNIEMVRYLLRERRCAVEAVDQQGATPLHIAAERGGVEVCWTLLQQSGCRMLHQKNYSGLTPLDLCKQGKTFRHQQLSKLLRRYLHEPMYHKPTESHVLYYWTLFFPLLSGAAILLIATLLGGYGGLICAFLFPWLARSIFTQYHRITTFQRLPNPVYLGTLLAGLFHSLLCYYGRMVPNALDQVSLFHFSILLFLFCKVMSQDPGVVDRVVADPRFTCIEDLIENNQSPHRFCTYCELFPPDYTKHCKLCEVCIKEYDHHCLFLNRCIGRANHRLFLFFIFSMVGGHLLFIVTAIGYLYGQIPMDSHSLSMWFTLLGEEFWVVVMIIMNALTLFWEGWLLMEQFDAITKGTTTYFRLCESETERKSLRQRLHIMLTFLVEGRRRMGSMQTTEDKIAIDI